jgi:hypothetical protein
MSIQEMQQYLGEVSIFDTPAPLVALCVILGANFSLTLLHCIEELNGRVWGYFGAISGIRFPDWFGFSVFTVLLTLTLWAIGFVAIVGGLPPFVAVPVHWGVVAIGVLVGGFIADTIFSHVVPHRAGYQPSPGLRSARFNFVQALIMAVLFFPGISAHPVWAAGGIVAGYLFFWNVVPILRLIRRFLPGAWREEPWEPGKPRPEWAR